MQIHTLTFCNLNSLQGRWTVDFTASAFRSSGIFAITGPTGAGKSTILDAICLALYGQTPRLNRITRNDNEIMSRQTGECSAEVTFSCSEGTFTSKWHQHRARRKPDGQLANARHELSDSNGRLIAEKLSDVPDVVEKMTGLSFQRFTRSVLLAQGQFNAFLSADANERAPILEQITGTEIYSDISVAVHERNRKEEEKLAGLQQQDALVQLISDEDRLRMEQEQAEILQMVNALTDNHAKLSEAIAWWVSVTTLEKSVQTLTERGADIGAKKRDFEPLRQQLQRARLAESLVPSHTALSIKRDDVKKMRASLSEISLQLPAVAGKVSGLQTALVQEQERLVRVRDEQERDVALRQKVRDIDIQIQEIEKKSAEASYSLENQHRQLESFRKRLADIEKQICEVQDATRKSDAYLAQHHCDEHLEAALDTIETRVTDVVALDEKEESLRRELTHVRANLKESASLATRFEAEQAAILEKRRTQEDHEKAQQATVSALHDGMPLKAYRAQLDALNEKRLLTRQIVNLKNERKRLRDGAPCPLCGATEHPYVKGQIPELEEVEREVTVLQQRIEAIEKAEAILADAGTALRNSEKELQTTSFQRERAMHQVTTLKENVSRLERELETVKQQRERTVQLLLEKTAMFGVSEVELHDNAEMVRQLRARAEKWKVATLLVAESSMKVQALELIHKETNGALSAALEAVHENEARLAGWSDEKAALWQARIQLYGEKSTSAEEARWQLVVADAETAVQNAQHRLQQAKTEETQLITRREEFTLSLDGAVRECTSLEMAFLKKGEALGFEDEAAFLAAQTSEEEIARLTANALQLDDEEKSVRTLLAEKTRQLEAMRQQPVSEGDENELQQQLEEVKTRTATLRETLGALRQKLADDTRRRNEKGMLLTKLSAQRKECVRWKRLHELIGSADGKKYRNFAQGLTFERLISHANIQLVRMTDRYLLLSDAAVPLAFSVVDNHQAGEVRSTRNLSGGETFIVSLALALGLAQMAGKTVRIDSLFLDEGFGTLDDQALETALEALGTLHHEGKLIGIISHVPALKERIACQIQVIPGFGGISTLLGPGCSGGNANGKKK